MRYTNRDLIAVRKVLEAEIVRLKIVRHLPGGAADAIHVNEKLTKLNRDRVALCAAVVHRRSEASKHVVSFSRWVSGNAMGCTCPAIERDYGGVFRRLHRILQCLNGNQLLTGEVLATEHIETSGYSGRAALLT